MYGLIIYRPVIYDQWHKWGLNYKLRVAPFPLQINIVTPVNIFYINIIFSDIINRNVFSMYFFLLRFVGSELFLKITAFDKLHMFSKTLDCAFGSYARLHKPHQFHATSFVLTLMWLASPWKCPNNGETARLSKRKKHRLLHLTMWHSAWVKRVRISSALVHSLRLSARDQTGRALYSALCNGPCCSVPRPLPPGSLWSLFKTG